MTHEYTILTGGVIAGTSDPTPSTAIAWAGGVVLAVGDDESVCAISRGDSHGVDLHGAVVRPLGAATLEVGDSADFEILDPTAALPIALVRAGHVVKGAFPGLSGE